MKTTTGTLPDKKTVRGILIEAVRFFKIAPFAVSTIWKWQPRLLAILAISALLDGIAPGLGVWISRYLLDAIVEAYRHQGQMEYVRTAAFYVFLQIAVTGGLSCLSKSMAYFKGVLAARFLLNMQTQLISGLSCLEMRDFDDPNVYDMIVRARGETQNNKPLVLVSQICDMVSSLITWISFSIILFRFSPWVVASMFVICIPYFVINIYFAKANYNLQFNRTHEQRTAAYLFSCFTERRALPEIITRDLWSFLAGKWSGLAQTFMNQDRRLLKRRSLAEIVIIVFTGLARGGVSFYIIIRCLAKAATYSVGQMMMLIQAYSGGISALAQVMQQLSGVYEGSCFLRNYQQFLDAQKASALPTKKFRAVPNVIESVELRNVSFKYDGSTRYALKNVNLLFRQGQSTLLVGNNGAGKTTLARLVIGLYSPLEGQILINGHDAREFDLKLLQRKMSIIFQDFVRYALTMEENIGLGSVEQMNDQQRVAQSARAARLDAIVARLPQGFSTMLGKEFRGGQDLSLGEWQRVCLARLFMRDASVMIYDEPSASLDVETESELLREIDSSGRDRICILISHRMLRSDIASRIVVMDKGEIVELGTHDELVLTNGKYAYLWRAYHSLHTEEERLSAIMRPKEVTRA